MKIRNSLLFSPKNTVSTILKFRNGPWGVLWKIRFIQYFFMFVSIMATGLLFLFFSNKLITAPGIPQEFLTTLIQVQAAIISLVITLTIIAIQMATASFSPRVVDVMKKSPDIWYLLTIYLISISFGFIFLKLGIPEPDPLSVSIFLIFGLYTFLALFLYMWNTIDLLRPEEIVRMLAGEINIDNVQQGDGIDYIFQPVFDVIHSSINRFDITTTRAGLNALFDRLSTLIPQIIDDSVKQEIVNKYCSYARRTALIALRNEDEGLLDDLIAVLYKFQVEICENCGFGKRQPVIETLEFIGIHAADKQLDEATGEVAICLGEIGEHAVDMGAERGPLLWLVILSLLGVGEHATKMALDISVEDSIDALWSIGKRVGTKGAEFNHELDWLVYALRVIGELAAEARRELGVDRVGAIYGWLSEFAFTNATEQKKLIEQIIDAILKVGTSAIKQRMDTVTSNFADKLGDIGISAADNEEDLDIIVEQAVAALEALGQTSAALEMDYAVESISENLMMIKEYISGNEL